MKKFVFLLLGFLMLSITPIFAQDGVSPPDSLFNIDLGTFTGITALISTLVTQVFKVFPAIKYSTISKIIISAFVGIAVGILGWVFKASTIFMDISWWQALIYGLSAGLSGCGLYDVLKAIYNLFNNKDSD